MDTSELRVVIGADVDQAVAGFKKVQTELQKTAKSMNVGSAAATDFTRTLQDLPFGITGVSNNIQQLAQSFGELKKDSGSTSAALKALGSSLIGPGGLALGITAITTALTFAEVGLSMWTRKSKEAKEKADEQAKAMDAITKQLATEAVRVGVLVSAIKSETTTRKEKIAAIDELKRINPDYFGQLNLEKGIVGQLDAAYKGYIANLKTAFRAKALEKEILPLIEKQIALERELEKERENRAKGIRTFQIEGKTAQQRLDDVNAELDKLFQNRAELQNFNIAPTGGGKTIVEQIIPPDFKAKAAAFKTELIGLQTILKDMLNPVVPGRGLGLQIISPEVLARAKEMQAIWNEQQAQLKQISNLVGGELTNAFSTVFDAAMNGEDVFKSLNQAVKQLVINLTKAVVQSLILKAVATAIGGPAGGIGASLIGGAIGGGVRAGGLGAGPALIAVGTLRGQDILLSVQRTERTNFING